jgi:ASCH domain
MKALSVRQPWAWLIVQGTKRVENRTWPTSYRGPLCIHAGLSRSDYHGPDEDDYGEDIPELGPEHFGALVGLVTLVDCVPVEDVEDQDYAEGPWCWILEDARAFPPIPLKGRLGIFTLPDDIAERIRRSAK